MWVIFDSDGGRDLRRSFFKFVREKFPENQEEDGEPMLPVFLIVGAFRQMASDTGLSMPSEFFLGLNDIDQVALRLRQLEAVHSRGLSVNLLRSICVGAFRKALCLDDENHGRGEMDPFDLLRCKKVSDWATRSENKQEGEAWPQHVIGRIEAIQEKPTQTASKYEISEDACAVFRKLFGPELCRVKEAMEAVQARANEESREESQNQPAST